MGNLPRRRRTARLMKNAVVDVEELGRAEDDDDGNDDVGLLTAETNGVL